MDTQQVHGKLVIMPLDSSSIHSDRRVLKAADVLPNGKIDNRVQILHSYYLRHAEAYRAFGEQAAKITDVKCLVIGLGNLSETIGFVAEYFTQHRSTSGLDLTLVDFVEGSFFRDLAAKPETYYLGKDTQGQAIKPVLEQVDAFLYDQQKGEFALGNELASFVRRAVDNGHYGVNIEDIDLLGIPMGYYDFLSCQNVLTYVTRKLDPSNTTAIDAVVASLVDKVAPGGILALKTNGRNKAIANSLENQNLPVTFLTERKYHNGLYKKKG